MKPILVSFVALVALASAACGTGDKAPAPTAVRETTPAATSTPRVTKTAKPTATARTPAARATAADPEAEGAVGAVFNTLFGSAFSSAGSGAAGLGEGDPALKQYLPSDDDFPSGYTPSGEYTFRTPDSISNSGTMDVAAKIASSGDITSGDAAGAGLMMAMVIKPQDLQDLGKAFDAFKQFDEQDLRDAIGGGSAGGFGFDIKNVKVLDAGGLGDGAAGIQLTIDVGGLIRSFAGDTDTSGAPSAISMRVYFFARGDYAGAVLRMAFSDTLTNDVDEVALAKIIDNKLKSAP